MKFYGFHKTTLLEYPKHIASILFTGGCNMRCPYCHNPELVNLSNSDEVINTNDFLSFLDKRKGILEAVCISGGEPLMHGDLLLNFIEKVKEKGLRVKIDTNGSYPELLKNANVDYIAMDIKTSYENYHKVGYKGDDLSDKIQKSINYIINDFNKSYEFRTTVVPGIVSFDDIKKISTYITGSKNYVLSQFRPMNTLDEKTGLVIPYKTEELEEMKEYCIKNSIPTTLRNNYQHNNR